MPTKKKLSRNMVLFSLLISGLGIFAWPLLLLGGLGVFISLMAWVYYSNTECKESIKPVLYQKDYREDEDFEIDTPFTGLELTLGLSGSYATDDVDNNNDTNNYSYD